MSDNYAIWTPQYDGHAPPNWKEGMEWGSGLSGLDIDTVGTPHWAGGWLYQVPAEALNSPNDDAKDVKPQDPRRSVHEALAILRGYSPEELAKHGITLASPIDIAAQIWDDAQTAFEQEVSEQDGRNAAIDIIFERIESLLAERNRND